MSTAIDTQIRGQFQIDKDCYHTTIKASPPDEVYTLPTMRLLDTTTKKLKTFYGEEIPEYAILSHMWGTEDDEVLFKHILGSDEDRREGKTRKGYAKIEGACKKAKEDGWEYIWIDTCCIDKGSSAELSEAINSMYAWYQNSEICYVYLEDVRYDEGGQSGSDKGATFPIVPFERSKWFSRGWTLQELIAPQYVVFCSKDWVDIGTKASLRDTITAVTRIRVEMLIEYDPMKASVAEKMSWAAFRTTTRAEDAAYCLMGLLGVNMPLLYGEGHRAFRRLQEELMKVSDDDSLFAWKGNFDKYENTRGMLARSPWEFRDGMNIVRSGDGAYSPYSMTNQGLKIKLPLRPIGLVRNIVGIDPQNIFKATLKCTIRARWVVVYFKMIREGYYQRIFPHWLDETETHQNATGLTSLLVPQTDAPMTRRYLPKINMINIEILPTESGFTVDDHSLVKGHNNSFIYNSYHKVIYFKHLEKHFALVIGLENDIPWLDFTLVIIEPEWQQRLSNSYKRGGPRYNVIARHLDRLSEKIPGEDWWVTVLLRKTGHGWRYSPRLSAIIDIHRVPPRDILSSTSTSDRISDDFMRGHNYLYVHPDFKKESSDWLAVFNPKIKRVLDVSLVYALAHERLTFCAQFSCDGKYLAIGGDMIRIYNIETGAESFTLVDENEIHCVCFSSDGKFLATGDLLGQVKLWDIGEGCIYKVFNNHQDTVKSICFSLDARLLISGSKNRIFQIHEIANGISRILDIGPDFVHATISPNGRLIAAQSLDGMIRIWDILTAQQLAELKSSGKISFAYVTFTSDEKGLVSSTHNTLKYWDISELDSTTGVKRDREYLNVPGAPSMLTRRGVGKTSRYTIFTGYGNPITSATVSHDERWVISGSFTPGDVLFWDLRNGTTQLILKTAGPLLGITSTGNIFATIHLKGVRVWRYDNI